MSYDCSDDNFDEDIDVCESPLRREASVGETLKRNRYDSTRRDHWAGAALAGFAYVAAFGALCLLLRERWSELVFGVRASIVLFVLTGTYFVAFAFGRTENKQAAKLFAIFGVALYGLALALFSTRAPDGLSTPAEIGDLLLRAFPSILPFWSVGAFALAMALKSRALHYVCACVLLLWLVGGSPNDARVVCVLSFCAIGEFWAWRAKSASVAFIYVGLGVVTLLTGYRLFFHPEKYFLVALFASVLFYWYGASINNAIFRGIALTISACALGVASFSQYWSFVLSEDFIERFGKTASCGLPATICSIIFIALCLNMSLSGARHSSSRFIFGCASIIVWTIARTIVSCLQGETIIGVAWLIAVAVFFASLIIINSGLNRKYRDRFERLQMEKASQTKEDAERRAVEEHSTFFDLDDLAKSEGQSVGTLVLPDEYKFDDFIDAEARATMRPKHVLALSVAYESLRRYLAERLERPLVFSAVSLQYACLVLNLIFRMR